VGVGLGDDPAFTPILPLGPGEGADVGVHHLVPELEVVGADLALAPPCPDQGIKMPEDGGAGTDPHEHLHKVREDRHEEDGVGSEVMKLGAELLQEQEEEGGDWRHQPAHGVRVEEDELPRGKVAEGDFASLIFPACSGAVHPRRRRTKSSWVWLWKRRRKGSEDMVMGAAIAGDESQGSRKEKKCQEQESRMQMCARKRRGVAASVEGKSEKVAVSFGAYLLCKSCSPSRAPR
jgi:hypothetical protein